MTTGKTPSTPSVSAEYYTKLGHAATPDARRTALGTAVERHSGIVEAACRCRLRGAGIEDTGLIEDATQNVFLQLVATPHTFTSEAHLRYWLLCVARGCAVDQIRSRSRNLSKVSGSDPDAVPAREGALDSSLSEAELRQDLRAIIKTLPQAQKAAFIRYLRDEILELLPDDVGSQFIEQLGKSETESDNLYQAKKKVRKAFERMGILATASGVILQVVFVAVARATAPPPARAAERTAAVLARLPSPASGTGWLPKKPLAALAGVLLMLNPTYPADAARTEPTRVEPQSTGAQPAPPGATDPSAPAPDPKPEARLADISKPEAARGLVPGASGTEAAGPRGPKNNTMAAHGPVTGTRDMNTFGTGAHRFEAASPRSDFELNIDRKYAVRGDRLMQSRGASTAPAAKGSGKPDTTRSQGLRPGGGREI